MIGNGQNKKSMAYVRNVVEFIKFRSELNQKGYHVFNYADKPDYSMSELIKIIEIKMKMKLPRIKIPLLFGMIVGLMFDFISLISKRNFLISSVRVKKFCATTQFDSYKVQKSFVPPYTLEEGLNKTLDFEFINPKQDDILFYSE